MKFDIPEYCHIRWQAALAVLEDLQEDIKTPFDMEQYADDETLWEKTNGCGSPACFAGYISVAPYCKALGFPPDSNGAKASVWLLASGHNWTLHGEIFDGYINEGSRAKTLAFLERRLKEIFKESTGKNLVAPITFYI